MPSSATYNNGRWRKSQEIANTVPSHVMPAYSWTIPSLLCHSPTLWLIFQPIRSASLTHTRSVKHKYQSFPLSLLLCLWIKLNRWLKFCFSSSRLLAMTNLPMLHWSYRNGRVSKTNSLRLDRSRKFVWLHEMRPDGQTFETNQPALKSNGNCPGMRQSEEQECVVKKIALPLAPFFSSLRRNEGPKRLGCRREKKAGGGRVRRGSQTPGGGGQSSPSPRCGGDCARGAG